jgi:glycosyltransferase involved in cell wall biosynthesis
VLVSSVWSPGKGAGLLADIAHRLPHRRIRVHGPNGVPEPQRSALSALPHVELSEGASEIDALLDGAGALLVPSQHAEPFGRVAFEGLAAGVPTLTSDVGGLKEYVPHAQRVAAYADPAAWATAVRRLEAPEAWARTSHDGLRAAAEVLARRGPERLEQLLVEAVELGDVPAGRGS